MGYLQPVSTSAAGSTVVWQHIADQGTLQGGFSLDESTLTAGETIKAGQPLACNESTRKAKVVKVAEMYASATNTATDYDVKKGHHFKVGDYLASVAGGKAYAITVIDTSDANFDTLTVGTTLAVTLSAGDVLFQSSATGASSAAYSDTVNGLLKNDLEVSADAPVTAVNDGKIYARRAPAVNSVMKALVPKIIYSQSK
jgi:hypothetical protein